MLEAITIVSAIAILCGIVFFVYRSFVDTIKDMRQLKERETLSLS